MRHVVVQKSTAAMTSTGQDSACPYAGLRRLSDLSVAVLLAFTIEPRRLWHVAARRQRRARLECTVVPRSRLV